MLQDAYEEFAASLDRRTDAEEAKPKAESAQGGEEITF